MGCCVKTSLVNKSQGCNLYPMLPEPLGKPTHTENISQQPALMAISLGSLPLVVFESSQEEQLDWQLLCK